MSKFVWQKGLFPSGPGVIIRPDLEKRLFILSEDAKYDLAGSCAKDPSGRGRKRGALGRWIYPVTLPNGRKTTLFRTLLTNVCVNDCAYCPLRAERDPRRVSLSPEELARTFMTYLRKGLVHGLFLSSGVVKDPDNTMELLIRTARLLREREGFRGYLHLKIIPGASEAALEEAARLADALSLNLETSGEENFQRLSRRKRYQDLLALTRKIAHLKARERQTGRRLSHTTQLVVGAAGERDVEILTMVEALYRRLGLNRVYFSAYQPGLGRPDLPGERLARRINLLLREHRLYQVDFLIRKYGFSVAEIPLKAGFLPLEVDPKEAWARAHPEFFPVNVNRASYEELLRVPGIGPTLARRIITRRREAKLRSLEGLTHQQALLRKAAPYICF